MKKVFSFWKKASVVAMDAPTSGAKACPTSEARVSPTSGAMVSPASGAMVASPSGTMVSPTSGTMDSPTSGTMDSPTSGAKVSPQSGAKVFTSSGALADPASGTMVSPTSLAIVTPTSQGSSGMEARRPNFQDKDMDAIHKVAREGNLWRMKQILFFRISDLNASDKMKRTALHVACAYGHLRMVKLLLKRHCIIDYTDDEQKTALIYALQYQNPECASVLLNYHPNLYVMDKDGNTAMHYAVLGHSTGIVEKMLIFRADIEAKTKDGLTPLALAKFANNEKMVKFLLSRGAKRYQIKRKQQLTSEYKEGRSPQTSQSSNLATDLQESPKPAQNKTKPKTVDETSAEGSLNSKQQLISEYKEGKNPPKSESSNLATDLQESPKPAQNKTKPKTVDEISAEGSLNSKQQVTSEYEEGRTQTLESSLFVEDISEEDSLISKQQLTSEYQERRKRHTSESTHHVVIDLRHTRKQAWTETISKTADETSAEGSLNSKQQLTSEYEEGRTQTLESSLFVEDISEEDSLISKQQLTSEYQERRKRHTSESTHHVVIDLRHTRKQAWTETISKTVDEISEEDSLSRLSKKSGIDDAWLTSHNEDFKEKVISKTCILTAKTSENQSKQIHLPPLHLEKTSQESQINRACDKEDTSAYSGHPSVQKDEEMCIKQSTLEQRKNLQLSKDESKQKPHEFSIKLKTTGCPEEEPPCDNSKGGASLRQMPSNLTSKMLDCEGKGAFGMSVSAALQTFPGREEPTLKIVPLSHAEPGSPGDSPSSSSSELPLRGNELHSENDHKPDAEHVLNKNKETFYNDTENKKVRHPVVMSEVIQGQEFAMQMNPNTTDWKLGIGPTPQSSVPKSHFDLWLLGCNETKSLTELKSHDTPAVTNTYKEIKPSQDLFQKPLCADNCSANYCKSMDSKLKDESSSALHNDRTPGAHVTEELQQDLQRRTNDVHMLKVEYLACKKEKIQLQKEIKEKKKQKISKREASGTTCDRAGDSDSVGLSQQSNSEHIDNQQPSDEINENTVIFLNKAGEKKEQKSNKREVSGNMDDGADDSDSGGWSQQSNSEQTDKQQVFIMENEDSDRFTLEEEKEKRQEVDLLYEKYRVQLRKKEEHSIKEVEMNPYLETTIRTRDIVSEIVRESEVSESSDKEKSLLRENHLLWDEIAKLRLEIDTVKNQTQEMGKKYFEDIAIIKEKNDRLQKTIRETVSQHNVQLEVLRAELIMLNSKLENEQQNRGRLEAEVESYQSRLAIAVQDHEHCQTSKRDLQSAFQRARDEWICLRDRMNFDMSNLKHNNEILSQQFSKMESKTNNLETELLHTRDALKERTLVLERDLSQKQCQQEETEHVYQEEQGKVDEDVGKQEYLQEKLSHLQRENKLLRQQLDQAHNKADREENRAINIQDQIQDKISIFNAESVKQIIMLDERINELINEWHHFNERIHQYDNDNVERDAIVRQLQQKISMIEASQEVESCHPVLLQDKTHDLKKDLDQSRSQSQHKKEESKKYIDLKVFLQQRLQQVLNKTDDLEEEVTRLKELLEDVKEKLNECDNEELSFPGDLKPSPANMEIQSKKPKQKVWQEYEEILTREVKEDAAKFEAES